MKILIDIGHPAHVHYFKNFIRIMESKKHDFLIIARDKEITYYLLEKYNIPYINRGAGGKSLASKILYIPKADLLIFKEARKFKPDLFLSFGSAYAAHAATIYGRPHIALDDTEHAKFEHLMYVPFTDTILNPSCFSKKLGEKQFFIKSYIELLYLHPNYFMPNIKVLELLNVKKHEDFTIVRFVSWDASHDINEKGLSNSDKIQLVLKLSERMKVFVSSEGVLPGVLKKYEFNIPFELMHDALFFAKLYVGEGGTTASEAAILGTPAIYLNNLSMGYIEDEKAAGLLYQTTDKLNIVKTIKKILDNYDSFDFKNKAVKFIEDKIDITAFLVWFIENYPESKFKMKKKPNFQNRFNN